MTKDVLLKLHESDANALELLVSLTGPKRVSVLRELIPPVEIIEALGYYHGGCQRNTDRIHAGMLQSIFVFDIIQRMNSHPDYGIPLQALAVQLGALGSYESAIAALYVKWSRAILKDEGFTFHDAKIAKDGKKCDCRFVLAPDDVEQDVYNVISGVLGDQTLLLNRTRIHIDKKVQ